MEFSFVELFLISVGLMTAVFFVYFALRAVFAYHNLGKNLAGIIFGTLVAGAGSGILLGIMGCMILPTYHYIRYATVDGQSKRFVYDEHFSERYGREYAINLTKTDCYLAVMTYGNAEIKENEAAIIPLESGYITELEHRVEGWFKPFPDKVSSKYEGERKWYVMTGQMLKSEYRKVGVDIDL